jgi:ABC-type xylose transport system permease subunit
MVMAMTFVLSAGEIELSVGAIAGLTSVMVGLALANHGLLVGILRGLAAGLVVGAINGALTAGARTFVIANADTVMTRATSELVAEFFPSAPYRVSKSRNGTLLSTDKASKALGYEPRFSWRERAR